MSLEGRKANRSMLERLHRKEKVKKGVTKTATLRRLERKEKENGRLMELGKIQIKMLESDKRIYKTGR